MADEVFAMYVPLTSTTIEEATKDATALAILLSKYCLFGKIRATKHPDYLAVKCQRVFIPKRLEEMPAIAQLIESAREDNKESVKHYKFATIINEDLMQKDD